MYRLQHGYTCNHNEPLLLCLQWYAYLGFAWYISPSHLNTFGTEGNSSKKSHDVIALNFPSSPKNNFFQFVHSQQRYTRFRTIVLKKLAIPYVTYAISVRRRRTLLKKSKLHGM